MEVRAATTSDAPAIESTVTTAFGPEEGPKVAELVRALDASGATRASVVAVSDDVVIGHVQLNRGWIDARRQLVEVLVLSPLSVSPTSQRNGVGTALVQAALDEARRLKVPAVFLEGSPTYYRSRGFEPGVDHGFIRPSVRIPEPAFQVAILPRHEPWVTGRLIYPEAFWTTDTVGLREPLLTELEAS